MPITYINRRGKTYYLHEGKTKTGKPKYFFTLKPEGNLVDRLPAGYEIYETPNAQVFLRKQLPPFFTPEEIQLVESGIRENAGIKYFKIDIKKKNLVIYLVDQNIDELAEMLSNFRSPSEARAVLLQNATFSPMMQIVLEEVEPREFAVERWCFLGAVDDWIRLDRSTNLEELVKKYCSHLGQDSFFDLM